MIIRYSTVKLLLTASVGFFLLAYGINVITTGRVRGGQLYYWTRPPVPYYDLGGIYAKICGWSMAISGLSLIIASVGFGIRQIFLNSNPND